jgi:hypothetical protein
MTLFVTIISYGTNGVKTPSASQRTLVLLRRSDKRGNMSLRAERGNLPISSPRPSAGTDAFSALRVPAGSNSDRAIRRVVGLTAMLRVKVALPTGTPNAIDAVFAPRLGNDEPGAASFPRPSSNDPTIDNGPRTSNSRRSPRYSAECEPCRLDTRFPEANTWGDSGDVDPAHGFPGRE